MPVGRWVGDDSGARSRWCLALLSGLQAQGSRTDAHDVRRAPLMFFLPLPMQLYVFFGVNGALGTPLGVPLAVYYCGTVIPPEPRIPGIPATRSQARSK